MLYNYKGNTFTCPFLTSQIAKADIQQFSNEQNKTFPYCSFALRWTGGKPIQLLLQKMTIKGTKEANRYFHIHYDPQAVGKYIG